MDKVTIT